MIKCCTSVINDDLSTDSNGCVVDILRVLWGYELCECTKEQFVKITFRVQFEKCTSTHDMGSKFFTYVAPEKLSVHTRTVSIILHGVSESELIIVKERDEKSNFIDNTAVRRITRRDLHTKEFNR